VKINAYLSFDGNCKEAFQFYAQCLGGKVVAMFSYGGTPAAEHVPAELGDKIMHARLAVGDQAIMGSDAVPQYPYEGVKGCTISLNVDTAAEAEKLFQSLSAGGQVMMPMQQTFWAERYGMFVDRFGVPWMVNCQGSVEI
jgi:PhnB protein